MDTKLRLVDAHNHLQDERLAPILEPALARARAVGIMAMVCCGSREADWPAVLSLADRFPGWVIPAVGLHPWHLRERSVQSFQTLEKILRDRPNVGIGECGLDRALQDCNDAEQEAVFMAQLDLAQKYARPVWIHARRAWGRLPDLLKARGPRAPGMVIHSYSGSPELIPPLSKLNVYFSFSGTITRSNNKRGRAAVARVPAERLLIETDAPDLPPVIRGPVNGVARAPEMSEPAHLVHVLGAVAEIRGWSEEEAAAITTENAKRLLGTLRGCDD